MGLGLIVMGTSWGGLRALETLLADLPAVLPVPVVVVQHRSSTFTESLCALLQRYTSLAVCEPDDKDPLLPGRIYLAPPSYHLLVERDHLALSVESPVHYARPSIDVLFESAADTARGRVIGVVLTGANADGALGLAAIKRRGGLAIVQDPATAEARVMPDAAIAATAVDHILPLAAIGPLLVGYFGRGGHSDAKRG